MSETSLAAWGGPRATVDVDLNVFVDDERLPDVFDVFERRLSIAVDRPAARGRHHRDGMFVLHSAESMRIDVFTPSIEFSWEAAKTASRVLIFETEVSVLSAEALARDLGRMCFLFTAAPGCRS